MKLVIQRVRNAKVTSNGKVVGSIQIGLFILVGVGQGDTAEGATTLAGKVANMRLMANEAGKMNLSVKESGGEALVVSQFTLYANTSGGRRPSFVKAASPDLARLVYENFIKALRDEGLKVETGSFGSYMKINANLDGPVTIIVEPEVK